MPNWYLLVSYPKSGNTWLRILLANLISDSDTPRSINQLGLPELNIFRRGLFDDIMGLDSCDLHREQTLNLLPAYFKAIFSSHKDFRSRFLKIHCANRTISGDELIPFQENIKAIYIMRNPLDVAVSLAYHLGEKARDAAIHLSNVNYFFPDRLDHLSRQIPEFLGFWSSHVISWRDTQTIPVMLIRYEDLLSHTESVLDQIVNFFELEHRRYRIPQAVEFAKLDQLRKQEEQEGFRETPTAAKRFFRKGGNCDWTTHLTGDIVDAICEDHAAVMAQHAYLPRGSSDDI